MASRNWVHLFIDGRRVSFDRRDDSVTLYPDKDFRLLGAEPIGSAKGSGRDWIATAPGGTRKRCQGRKAAAIWLIEETHEERTERAATHEKASRIEEGAVDEAVEILRTVRPNDQRPTPVLGDPDAKTFFVFRPDELRDLLKDLRGSASE